MHHILSFFLFFVNAPELIIGKEKVPPGIVFIFEGAVKDQIIPDSYHLKKNKTNVHIEARVNWDNKNIPKGTPSGGSASVWLGGSVRRGGDDELWPLFSHKNKNKNKKGWGK